MTIYYVDKKNLYFFTTNACFSIIVKFFLKKNIKPQNNNCLKCIFNKTYLFKYITNIHLKRVNIIIKHCYNRCKVI